MTDNEPKESDFLGNAIRAIAIGDIVRKKDLVNMSHLISKAEVRKVLSSENIEKLAENVHDAYLATCERLGWSVSTENDVPYEDLSEDSKELDRATVRAVLSDLLRALHISDDHESKGTA